MIGNLAAALILALTLALLISDLKGPPSAGGQLTFEFVQDTYRTVKWARKEKARIRRNRAALKFYRKDPDRTSLAMFFRMYKESRA